MKEKIKELELNEKHILVAMFMSNNMPNKPLKYATEAFIFLSNEYEKVYKAKRAKGLIYAENLANQHVLELVYNP